MLFFQRVSKIGTVRLESRLS